MVLDDTQIINNILNGDVKSEEILYSKYDNIIREILIYNYGNYPYIEDDVSEILTKIFKNLDRYNSKKSQFKTWAYTIVKNYMIDKHRKKPIPGSVCITNTTISDIENTFNTVSDIETSNTLEYIKSNLSNNDYIFLDLKYNQGYNYCEIGCVYNMTSSTVSNKVNYIKRKLKNTLNKPDFI
jgi:RNA polymerase sigma-70 factor (ECF subfamily)